MPLIKEFKTPELNEIFKDNIDDKPLIKKKKVIVKKPSKPNNFEYDVQTIEDDYKYFNIDFEPKNSNIKYQEKFVELNKMSFKALFQFEHHNFENSNYNRHIYLTEEILDSIVDKKEDYKVVDLNTYKLILFLNVCYDEKNNEKYELFDEHFEIPVMKNYKKFYEGDFNTYFNNKYKDNSVLNNEIMSRIKLFNYHYDKIYPHNFNRVDNPTEYNKVSKNKSNLKTQYRKYLEGNDISTLNNIPALKMIIYIIENVEIN
tara:strand:- start:385 stop:1161 length:777 start_codon:yes stop_codon:yes gene_type:complete